DVAQRRADEARPLHAESPVVCGIFPGAEGEHVGYLRHCVEGQQVQTGLAAVVLDGRVIAIGHARPLSHVRNSAPRWISSKTCVVGFGPSCCGSMIVMTALPDCCSAN